MSNRVKGRLTTIAGCMFAGKTEELVRLANREKFADRKIKGFKPDIDNRYSLGKICSHSGMELEAICLGIEDPSVILKHVTPDIEVVAIEEVQFFGPEIIDTVNELIERGVDVFVSGLDLDFRGEVFGSTYMLMAFADYVVKVAAVCMVAGCRNEATRTQRMSSDEGTIVVGEKDKYEARCRNHFVVPV